MEKIELGFAYLKTGKQLEIELFNKKRYRLINGYGKMQIPLFTHGKVVYSDFGKDIPLGILFDQIKCVYHDKKLLALRLTKDEPLFLRDTYSKKVTEKRKLMLANKKYQEFIKKEFDSWLKKIRHYCYEHY